MKVVVVGAGMSGLLTGIRLKQAGHRLHHHREERRRRRHLARERLSRLPGRQPQPHVLLLLRAQPRLPAILFHPAGAARLFPQGRRQARPAPPHPLRDRRSRRRVFDEARGRLADRGQDARTGANEFLEADALITAVGQLNQPALSRHRRRRDLRGPELPLRPLAPRRRPDRQARGRDRHRRQRLPVRARRSPPRSPHLDVFQRTPPWLHSRRRLPRRRAARAKSGCSSTCPSMTSGTGSGCSGC